MSLILTDVYFVVGGLKKLFRPFRFPILNLINEADDVLNKGEY